MYGKVIRLILIYLTVYMPSIFPIQGKAVRAWHLLRWIKKESSTGKPLQWLKRRGVVLADVQGVQKELMKRKRYIDVTGNLLNHPNDYLARIQAQVLCTTLMPS